MHLQVFQRNRVSADYNRKAIACLNKTSTFSGRQVFITLLEAPGDYKVRMTFSQHEDKIFIVSGSAPVSVYEKYEKYMRIFGLAAVSFHKL